jgi:hypothetical protein
MFRVLAARNARREPTITVAPNDRSPLALIEADRTHAGIHETITVSVTLANTGNTPFSLDLPVVTANQPCE